ncbi:MAG: FAD-dependent oxidoreductase [Oceanipulchritudo sp.]
MKQVSEPFDVVVLGGGLAGWAAAVAAARNGAKTALVQDRPVLGGNSSSEIRVTPHGAGRHHPYAAETGIVAEAILAERMRCHVEPMENGWTNSQWDLALYDICQRTPGLKLFLNTMLTDVLLDDGTRGSTLDPDDKEVSLENGYRERPAINPSRRIAAVECRVANAETLVTLQAKQFIDCTGDGLCAHMAGCSWRWGSEGKDEFKEVHAPRAADAFTMGSSLQFYCHDGGRPVPFSPPPWAKKYDDAAFFWGGGGRRPTNPRGGFWWIEIGVPFDTITDNEQIREELTAHVLGVWDWMKNKDAWMKDKCANYVLDWVGQVPGKRESRRIMGRHFINENELSIHQSFPDNIGHGGWFLDLHTPGGLLAENAEPMAAEGYADTSVERANGHVGPYPIPLRILQSRDIDNLGMAGRCVSATKAALGSLRVMQTCAVMGEAIGTAVAVACSENLDLAAMDGEHVKQVQSSLRRSGVFLPSIHAADADNLIGLGSLSATSEQLLSGGEPSVATSSKAEPRNLRPQPLDLAQAIPVRGDHLESLSLCLSLDWPGAIRVPVRLRQVPSIWHYDVESGPVLAEGEISVPPGVAQWCEWTLGLKLPAELAEGGYLRLELEMAMPGKLYWETTTGPLPSCPAYFLMPSSQPGTRGERYRRHNETPGSTFAFRLGTPQAVFPASNVLDPAGRPFTRAGAWRSDPQEPLPQSWACRWEQPQSLLHVDLHFGADLLTELSTREALSVNPGIARDYRLEALVDGEWRTVAEACGNYQMHRFHRFPGPLQTTALRVVVLATNGSASASLAGVRAYTAAGSYPDPWESP